MDNHAPLAREELEPLVEDGCTLAEIGKRLGRPPATVRRAIARSGLPQPIEIRRRLIDEALAAGRNTLVRDCWRHGRTEFAIVGSERRLHCKRCRAEAVARRRRKVKRLLVDEAAMRGITRSIETVRREVEKCVLLCANCHAEVECGATKLPG